MLAHIFGNRRLHGCRNKEVLLLQAQLLARIVIVIGIENLHNIPCKILLLHSLAVIALVKGIQLEAFHRLRIPDSEGIHDPVAISHNRKVIGHCLHALIALLNKIASSVLVDADIHIAAELDLLGIFRPAQLKGIAVNQPVVRHLHLIAVPDLLLEHTVAVADPAAVRHVPQSRKGIQKACRKSSEAAVSQSRIRLLILDHVQIQSQLL